MPERIITKDLDIPGIDSLETYRRHGGYKALAKALSAYQPDQLVDLIKQSGLRGRGGTGFPTGMKWGFLAKNDKPRYLCCNADESEPGTCKYCVLMENIPYRLIEGVIITTYACRVTTAFIYVRGELAKAGRQVERAVQEAYDAGPYREEHSGEQLQSGCYRPSRCRSIYLWRRERLDGIIGGTPGLPTPQAPLPRCRWPLWWPYCHQ